MARLTGALTFLVVAVLLSAAPAKRGVYRNEEFGITVPVPKGALLCPTPDDQHDHGPAFLFATGGARGCRDLDHARSVDVFASYNAAEVTKKLHDFLKWECANVAKGPCRPAPGGLQVAGLPSEAARVDAPDGWVYIIVVTQAGKPDPAFDPSVPSVNYDLSLHTRPQNLEEDLRVFRRILQTIRLSPPAE